LATVIRSLVSMIFQNPLSIKDDQGLRKKKLGVMSNEEDYLIKRLKN
jgi:hypothetical protein